jgi:hypothetical protein
VHSGYDQRQMHSHMHIHTHVQASASARTRGVHVDTTMNIARCSRPRNHGWRRQVLHGRKKSRSAAPAQCIHTCIHKYEHQVHAHTGARTHAPDTRTNRRVRTQTRTQTRTRYNSAALAVAAKKSNSGKITGTKTTMWVGTLGSTYTHREWWTGVIPVTRKSGTEANNNNNNNRNGWESQGD